MISFISALIDESTHLKSPEIILAFQDSGLAELIFYENEMVVYALYDMFEGLILIYPDESIIIEVIVQFLNYRLSKPENSQAQSL